MNEWASERRLDVFPLGLAVRSPLESRSVEAEAVASSPFWIVFSFHGKRWCLCPRAVVLTQAASSTNPSHPLLAKQHQSADPSSSSHQASKCIGLSPFAAPSNLSGISKRHICFQHRKQWQFLSTSKVPATTLCYLHKQSWRAYPSDIDSKDNELPVITYLKCGRATVKSIFMVFHAYGR